MSKYCWNIFCSNETKQNDSDTSVRLRNTLHLVSNIMDRKSSKITKFYRRPALTASKTTEIVEKLQKICEDVESIATELCYYIETSDGDLKPDEITALKWLLQDPLKPDLLTATSQLKGSVILEVGPRFNFSTSQSTNSVSICNSLGLKNIVRLEVSRRYEINSSKAIEKPMQDKIVSLLHDRMTECQYTEANIPKNSFNETLVKKENMKDVDILNNGKVALQEIDKELGLAFDDVDIEYYTDLFKNKLKRNPTTVELFDLAQSNSEHSRHWFFKGKMVIDGEEMNGSLIDMIMKTQEGSNDNNVIKFSDNSSAIKGYVHRTLRATRPGEPGELRQAHAESSLTFTAETHNFPTAVAPFSGATTGPGGRIRDVQAVGRGGHCIAGTAGYAVGNLNIPDYLLSWEDPSFVYPSNFAAPLDILIQASNGASDYGNKFGEPLISGFVRSFGMIDPENSARREWIKPIMFSGGIGHMDASMTKKEVPLKGDVVVKVGGPVYRIGVGGGAASSVEVQGDNKEELDFNAVQRGDAEMENKMNRVIRACIELGQHNPILSIHDQGAGGNGNVLKELIEPAGAVIYANRFQLGDPTVNALELWGAEYQESNAMLCKPESMDMIKGMCARERCPVAFVGEVTGDGKVVLSLDEEIKEKPVDLNLELVLGKMPQKVYNLSRQPKQLKKLILPEQITIYNALKLVLRLPSISSKRYLTNKVDRCVTGLVAQQQCVGPLHTPLADVAVTAISYFGYEGIASSIGEQPIKGLVNSGAGARMAVGEALSNLVFAAITDIKDIKCSGNWMWAAKLPGEGAELYDACVAMTDVMAEWGIAVDGGKDSLSMAARVNNDTVKSPGSIVVSAYAPCPDIRRVVTPDLKAPSMNQQGVLLYVDFSRGLSRLGGSALAQCYKQLGDSSPDLENTNDLLNAFKVTQELIKDGSVLAGHDVSDGGVITCLLEMCFGGISGINVNITHKDQTGIEILFCEEAGWILEVLQDDSEHCMELFLRYNVPVYNIGNSVGYGIKSKIAINVDSNHSYCFESTVLPLMQMWEETSYNLELLQTRKECAKSEFELLERRKAPKYELTFDPDEEMEVAAANLIRSSSISNGGNGGVKVAVLREEGTNGDREMAAALIRVGFIVWDVTMQDLLAGKVTLDAFRGVIFPGGFSYADVLGSARGWAATILFNPVLQAQFKQFFAREDTFSLGVCNGCQLMALLGWIGTPMTEPSQQPDIVLTHNKSERFECRWNTVKIPDNTKAIMLKGMEGSSLGVWSAHGEGRFDFKNESVYTNLVIKDCVALRFVDDDGLATEKYPLNPNGSTEGLAAVCSPDGRHLAMMPHPERCEQMYQWPYIPHNFRYKKSPWERMFRNAITWCHENTT